MSRWSLPSLKLTVPLLLIGFCAILLLIFYTFSLPHTLGLIEEKGREHLLQRISHLQGSLEYLVRRDDIPGLQREIAALASQVEYEVVVLADDTGHILAATRRAWLGKPITEVLPLFEPEYAAQAARQRSALIVSSADDDTLVGYTGIMIAASPATFRHDRFGQLFFQYDLSAAKHAARNHLLQQLVIWTLMIGGMAVLLWLAFQLILTRRAERLIQVAERLAEGDLSVRSELPGRDELARLSRALDTMAERVDRTRNELAKDVAKREQAELAVRESEARLQQILNNTTSVIYVRDREERFLLVNRQFERLLGTKEDAVAGKPLGEIFPDETTAEFRANDLQVLARNKALEFEEHVTLDDGVHTYLSIKFPLHDTTGRSYAVCGISTDITRRKQSEEALRQAALGISEAQGKGVFRTLVTRLARALDTDLAFIGVLKGEDRISTRALYAHGRIETNITYPLDGSPCQNVVGQRFRFYPDTIQQRFPQDTLLREIAMEGYAALPLFDSGGRVLGLIAVLHGKPLRDRELTESILQVFSGRAASELERERADIELRKSEASYRGLFDSAEDCIFIHDINTGAILDVNPKACLTYGYSREEFREIDIETLSSGEDPYNQAGAIKFIEKAIAGEPMRFEWHRRNKDDSLHWDEVILKRVQLAGVDRILAMTREITARKQAEESLRESEAQYREANARLQESEALKTAIIDNALLAVISMDDRGYIVEFNPAAERMFGHPREHVLDHDLADTIIPERLREAHRMGLQRYLSTLEPQVLGQRIEQSAMRADGSEFPLELSISATHVGGNNFFTAFIADLTDKKRSEAALRASEEQYRAIFRASTDGLALWRDDGTIIDMNPAFCAMHGYTQEEFPQLSPPDFIAADSLPAFEEFTVALKKGLDFHTEARGRKKDGSEIDIEVHAAPIRYQGRPHELSIVRDITEKKRAERDRRELEQQLRQAQKMEAIGHLTGGIAHDFNNLLTSMMGYCTLGIERLEQKPDQKLDKYLNQIQKSGEKARDLIQQMLTFSRGKRGEPRALSLAPLISDSCNLMQSTIPSSVEFGTDLEKPLPPVLLDPVHVEQIMMNLCINARDAMDNRGVLSVSLQSVDAENRICTGCRQRINGRYVELSVQDTGSGMTPEVVDRIFEPFFTTKAVGKGTGMGLSTVHGIVHEHGGHIQVKSKPGAGTVFRVLFPALSGSTLGKHTDDETGEVDGPASIDAHVLVVDDEASVAEFMADLLESRGLRVSLKINSLEALRVIQDDPQTFDLVVTDQTMPKLTGTELAAAIRDINPELPVILYSGYSEHVPKEKIEEYGIRAFLRKPVDIDGLFSCILEILPHKAQN